MSFLRRLFRFISSMKFAIILLVILVLVCFAGSFVTQNQSSAWYAAQYGERTGGLIMALRLDDVFHSWYFILISGFLCLNLLLCNVVRLPRLIGRTRKESTARAKLGCWGAWITHVGVLLLILGYSLGQMTYKEYTVYGVPGQTMAIGDTGLVLTINDFSIGLRDDDTVEQYTSDITVYDIGRSSEGSSAQVSVNNPADLFGLRFYQNSTGWAAGIDIRRGGEQLQHDVVCAGDYISVADNPDLVVMLNAFYPDYQLVQGYGPTTLSSAINNPGYLYSVYYQGRMIGMNVLMQDEVLKIDDYEVTFSDPQNYTLIQIKRDSFTPLAFAGGLVVMVGLIISFYVRPPRRKEEDASG